MMNAVKGTSATHGLDVARNQRLQQPNQQQLPNQRNQLNQAMNQVKRALLAQALMNLMNQADLAKKFADLPDFR